MCHRIELYDEGLRDPLIFDCIELFNHFVPKLSTEGIKHATGGAGADYFDCGKGIDEIIDYNPQKGDTKAANCEHF